MMASLLLWSLYLFLSVLSHATAQEIIQVSFEFEVEHVVINGNGAVARCTVTGYDSSLNTISSFIWKHNNTIIDLSSSTRHSESGSERTKRLDITSLMFNDAGSYSCIVEFVNLQQVSSTTDTLRIGTEITVEAESPQYAVAGQTGELRCTAQSSPSPSINWYRVESDTLLLQQFDSTASDFGVYRISNVQTDDAGLYKCRGSYSFGSKEKEIQLIVLNRPTVTGTQFDETVMVGATFSLSCTVNDDATTAVHGLNHSWTFTPHDSTESARLTGTRYSIDATSGSLTVTGASYDDAGVYSCEVSNAAGNDTQNNMVSIEGAPFITLETGLITQGVSSTASKVYLDCPFIGNPSPTVAWYDGERLIAEDSKYRIHENGTLEISDYNVLDTVTYRCEVNNEHGMDDRNYDFQLWEISSEPSNLVLTIDPNDDRTVTLTWNAPTEMSGSILFNSAEFYVVEQSINNEEYAQVETVPSTSVTLSELLPGETHTFRVMAGNIAGLSTPSVTVTHTPAPREPSLSLFQVTPLLDGRSMLVSWELEFDGGSDITSFSIQVLLNGDPFINLSVDVSDGELTIVNLDPDTEYTVSALLINAVGPTTAQETLATLPALPSPPSLLTVTHSSGYHTISFSIKKGSSPITHFIINYTQSAVLTSPEQLVIASNDSNSVISMEGNGTSGVDTEHSVVLKLAGLEKSAEVRVAGRSELGDGPFSEVGMIESKEHVIYVIIAAVVGGMLLVVTVILTAVIIAVCRKKCNRGRKIAITARGIRPSSLDLENGIDSFALKSPPNGRRAGSFVRSPPLTPSTTREGISSPLYSNSLSSSVTKLNTQNSVSGSNLDTVVDMHNDSLTIKISDFHSSSKSIPHNYSPPEGNNRQHLCLQTSLSGDRNDVRSVVSENHLLVIPNNSNDSTLSKSTPMMNRLSCDSVLDTMPTSYMTDV